MESEQKGMLKVNKITFGQPTIKLFRETTETSINNLAYSAFN